MIFWYQTPYHFTHSPVSLRSSAAGAGLSSQARADADEDAASTFGVVRVARLAVPFFEGACPNAAVC
jgi:hypothetical protein